MHLWHWQRYRALPVSLHIPIFLTSVTLSRRLQETFLSDVAHYYLEFRLPWRIKGDFLPPDHKCQDTDRRMHLV
ncbi:hypothetical protein C8Q69DRAFT_481154 [Paecilomyces variotii]|uniref:Uncharacterized protein n=1 Tax=Byssochlamys spectabilis TaxID=264951 RepID=A0A443HIZ3_BYSSP|nr:hypothetical protein C8Q69DRAFT_481154 [Paecilomyces variotii]RWQ91810.1 hypothetical protein C8Q69DRAFT_481154 [Paecilomyces variotii]